MTLYKNSLPFNQFKQMIKGVGEILQDFELNFGSYCIVIEHLTVLKDKGEKFRKTNTELVGEFFR